MAREIYVPINYYSSRALMRLFDKCYKMGVEDAIAIGNEMQCVEFCDKMYRAECFGRIVYDYEYSWREWKYRLSQIIYEDVMYRHQGLKYFECITTYGSYLACVMPIAMDFYMKGLKDYAEYPNSDNWVKFNSQSFMIWGKTIRKSKMDEFLRFLTGFCFDRIRIDQAAIEFKAERLAQKREEGTMDGVGRKKKGVAFEFLPTGLTRTSYENFQREIWRHTRVKEYAPRRKLV